MTDETFRALLLSRDEEKRQSVAEARLTVADLMPGDAVVRISHSTVNYKDGLALTGKAPVVRRWPMIPGIDLAGTVVSCENAAFAAGDAVIVNGWGLGETHYGAYADMARLNSAWLTRRPLALSSAQTMAIGTAGFTAMLCVEALERYGLTPAAGPVLVTGASGGVGSVAITLLAGLGYRVVAATGRVAEASYLTRLGASEIVERQELLTPPKPLGKETWAAAIDTVGSTVLANVLSRITYGGAVAACGLAGGMDLPVTVAPFILRNVSLIGVDSVMAPPAARDRAWARLATELDRTALALITTTIGFADLPQAGADIVAGKVRGRLVVDLGG